MKNNKKSNVKINTKPIKQQPTNNRNGKNNMRFSKQTPKKD